MRFYLISDDTDTLVGMRLAGIEGEIVHTEEEFKKALEKAAKIEDIAVILITEKLTKFSKDLILKLKTACKKPLITTIPGRNSSEKNNNIMKYVQEAIGVKV